MSPYRKLIAAAVGALVLLAHKEGVEIAEDVSEPVIGLLTALAVYLFPNTP
jgi:hypothetical protein